MKLIYRHRLFLSLALAFTIFTVGILLFEQVRERKMNIKVIESKLDAYAEVASALLFSNDSIKSSNISNLQSMIPKSIRVTVIDKDGRVSFDNNIDSIANLQSHANRPEIYAALKNNKGRDIRKSETTKQEYIYYAKRYDTKVIRIAMPYDVQAKKILKGDDLFLNFILIFFVLILFLISRITGSFNKSITELHKFVLSSNDGYRRIYNFPKDELGDIAEKITNDFMELKESKKMIDIERDKLLQHIHSSEEGVCFFSDGETVQFYNGLFIKYLNTLTNEPQSEPYAIFYDEIFKDVNQFLLGKQKNYFETQIKNHGKVFSLRINIFEDNSFEIVLNDITKQERTRQLKQEMTGNIAHEIRTPVTGIRGYLETVLEQPLSDDQKEHFIKQAYNQTITLSELIRDMSLLTKIEDAPQSFQLEKVNLNSLLESLRGDYMDEMEEKRITFNWSISPNVTVLGNTNLIYSIFRNLLDNSIRYAGENISININIYKEDNQFFYFSFSDNGVGIADQVHLNRLFERFYRISEGRTRSTGGSGLGLSIVKNAIAFHHGTVIAKNRAGGGLEFLFQLHK